MTLATRWNLRGETSSKFAERFDGFLHTTRISANGYFRWTRSIRNNGFILDVPTTWVIMVPTSVTRWLDFPGMTTRDTSSCWLFYQGHFHVKRSITVPCIPPTSHCVNFAERFPCNPHSDYLIVSRLFKLYLIFFLLYMTRLALNTSLFNWGSYSMSREFLSSNVHRGRLYVIWGHNIIMSSFS